MRADAAGLERVLASRTAMFVVLTTSMPTLPLWLWTFSRAVGWLLTPEEIGLLSTSVMALAGAGGAGIYSYSRKRQTEVSTPVASINPGMPEG